MDDVNVQPRQGPMMRGSVLTGPLARRLVVVLGYWLLWAGAWRLAIPFEIAPRISVWWPPAGITFAFLLLFGWRYLPAVTVPQIAIMALILPDRPIYWIAMAAIVSAGFGGAAEAVRYHAGRVPFLTARNVCIFLAAACSASAAVAIPGAIILGFVDNGPWADLRASMLSWWIGDLAAITILTPFVVFALDPVRAWVEDSPQPHAHAIEQTDVPTLLAVLAATVAALAIAFAGAVSTGYMWFFVLFLPALYAGYALGPRGAAATALVVALGSLALLQVTPQSTRPLDLQFFMIATATASLLFAIVVSDWRTARRGLLEQQADLEDRVAARTQELAEANAQLETEIGIRKAAEQALVEAKDAAEASYRELDAIYRYAPIGLTLIDKDDRYLRVNETLAEINGLPPAQHRDRTLSEVVPDVAPLVVPHVRAVFATGQAIRNVEFRGRTRGRPEEATVWLDHFYPLKRADGTVEAVNIVVQEITDQRRAEEDLLRAKVAAEQASALKSRFLAATSHDLRQPLQTLSLLQSILVERIKDEDLGRVIAQMGVAVDVMTDTLNALLDVDGLEKGRLEPKISDFPIQALFDRMQTEFASTAAQKKLLLKRFACRATVRSDQRLLERLVENFVANAVKYTEQGKVLVGCRRRGGVLRIEVWDTGPGISEAEQKLIFEQFYRGRTAGGSRERGLGLGLALVRSLADILDHRVGVRSIEGRGSMFFVEVPLGASAPTPDALPAPQASSRAHFSPIIILIEDDPAVRESLAMLLSGNDYTVREAATGEEAVHLVEHEGLSPSLVIADHNLPGVLTGVDAAERIRGRRGPVPGLILTGEGSRQKLERYTSEGLKWLQKPVKADELLARVRALVNTGDGVRSDRDAGSIAPSVPADDTDDDENDDVDGRPTVFIVEDDDGLRAAVALVLEGEGFHLRPFATAADFLAGYRRGRGGCILIDIGLPGMNGLQLQQRLKSEEIDLPVIIVSGRGEVALAVQAMRDGAVDFLQKPVDDRMLVDTVRRALRRSQASAEVEAERMQVVERLHRLTPREQEILRMVAAGLANKEIAARLEISQRTVENHRARVMHKMEARSLADLVRAVSLAGDPAGGARSGG